MRNPNKADLLMEVLRDVPKGPCCYLLYRVVLSSCPDDVALPWWNVLEWGWPGTSGVGIHSEMLVVYLIRSEQQMTNTLLGWGRVQ